MSARSLEVVPQVPLNTMLAVPTASLGILSTLIGLHNTMLLATGSVASTAEWALTAALIATGLCSIALSVRVGANGVSA